MGRGPFWWVMSKPLNLTGRKFELLTVVERRANDRHGNSQWLCCCKCGCEVVTTGSKLLRGRAVSCGKKGCKKGTAKGTLFQWTPAQIEILGTDTDRKVARRIGKGVRAVASKRWLLGIPSFRRKPRKRKCANCGKEFESSGLKWAAINCSKKCAEERERAASVLHRRRSASRKQIRKAKQSLGDL